MTTSTIEAGDPAPAFTLLDQDGREVSLADFSGQRVIVYFYPAAMTPGCTTQACDFSESLARFSREGYAILGISKDPVAKLKRFAERDGIAFPLLSDEDLRVHRAFGAYGTKNSYGREIEGVLRSTFVIDERGIIEIARRNVKATGHVAMLAKLLGLPA